MLGKIICKNTNFYKNGQIWKTFHWVMISDGILSCLGSKKSRSIKKLRSISDIRKWRLRQNLDQLRNFESRMWMYSEVMKFSDVKFLGCFSEADLSNESKILQTSRILISSKKIMHTRPIRETYTSEKF